MCFAMFHLFTKNKPEKKVAAKVYPFFTSNFVQNFLQTISKGMSLGHRHKKIGSDLQKLVVTKLQNCNRFMA